MISIDVLVPFALLTAASSSPSAAKIAARFLICAFCCSSIDLRTVSGGVIL